ncbi:MAG: hypothetical protein H8D23_11375, partial [Candidatus Brocadiales bacterium]|nr:hypothetical protein [Candidatus Brocadiales bacterium]
GSIKIESALGVGTTIILLLPKATPPKSFVSELVFQDGDLIAVVDDDQSIHNIWEGRIASLGDSQVRLIHFSDPHEFMAWSKDHKANHYLIDFEFIGSSYNGLKIIRELNLQENVCLVTSRFEEENIITECEDLCIGLIPKGLAGFISSRIEKKSSNTEAVIKTILIDDDALIRMVWESEATEKSIPFMKNKVEVQPVKSGQRATAKKPRITQNLTSLFIIIQPFFAFLLRPIRITFDVNNMSTCG